MQCGGGGTAKIGFEKSGRKGMVERGERGEKKEWGRTRIGGNGREFSRMQMGRLGSRKFAVILQAFVLKMVGRKKAQEGQKWEWALNDDGRERGRLTELVKNWG